MKNTFFILLLLILPCYNYAEQKIFLDNQYIQEYKGTLGKWFYINNKNDLKTLSASYYADFNHIYKINDIKKNPSFPNYYFIPYSESYINASNISRDYLFTDEDQFIWPITDPEKISSVLGFRNRKFHPGLDVPALKGMPILASMEGIVIYSNYNYKTEDNEGYGNVIILKHKNNFYTRYAHNMANFVKKGDFIKKGQIIGLVGSTGHSTGNHVHYELRCNDIPLDPLDFLPDKKNLNIVFTLKNWK
jgi:murein DD-endopeptidase MepM/ murein hydrolase activator NlpD